MENSNQENKETQNPQPADQVQLDIETVTPTSEKVIPETESHEGVDNETAKANSGAEEQPVACVEQEGTTTAAVDEDTSTAAEAAEQSTAQPEDVANEQGEEQATAQTATKDTGDERDEIETVSP